jgi:hypothetical protein
MFSKFSSLAFRLLAIGLISSAALVTPSKRALAQATSATSANSGDESLRHALQLLDASQSTQYIAVLRDLNGDGNDEAIVYMLGDKWCGSGGCNTLVLRKDGMSWKVISKITVTRPPIRVLPETSHDWHSIGVFVVGGGINPGYEAVLKFDGKSYPRNPTIPPVFRAKSSEGDVVISSTKGATALYP